jgi:hypothetical protein
MWLLIFTLNAAPVTHAVWISERECRLEGQRLADLAAKKKLYPTWTCKEIK